MGKEFGRARLELVRAGPVLRGRAAGEPGVARAGSVRARVPAASRGQSSPPSAGDSRRSRRRRWNEMRLRPSSHALRLEGCVAVRVAVVWRARRQRRRISPLWLFLFFCRGSPLAVGAPSGAQSSPEGRPFEPRPRLCNSGALLSLVLLDFKSSRQTGSAPDHQRRHMAGCEVNCNRDIVFSLTIEASAIGLAGAIRRAFVLATSLRQNNRRTTKVPCQGECPTLTR